MTKEEAIKIATEFVRKTYERDLTCLDCGKGKDSNFWVVHFRRETPEFIILDPAIGIIVHEETGKAQLFDDWFNEEKKNGNFEIPPLKPPNAIQAKRIEQRNKKRQEAS